MNFKCNTEADTVYCPHCFELFLYCSCFDEWEYPESASLERQSAEVPVESGSGGDATTEETTQFLDENQGMNEDMVTLDDPVSLLDQLDVASLAQFLSRPVRIKSFTWNESDPLYSLLDAVDPWYEFFNDPRIKNKLHNFAFLRCQLKLKIIINASPFYYGMMGAAYQPLPALTPSTMIPAGQQSLMPISQRPIVWIYPQESKGGEMTLPFFYHKNWLPIKAAQDFRDMGRLDFYSFTDLQSANGVTGSGVTVQVFAWAEDVQLSGSTLSLAVQSSESVADEYGTGSISAPASTVATIASRLKSVPVIGKFATATEIGARAVSGIAKLFGFTNVPVISDIEPFQPRAFPAMASAEIGFPNDKLTLDPKNELSVDPTLVGAPDQDPLAIANLVTRESYLVGFTWNTTNVADDILFYTRVNPWMFRQNGNVNNSIVDLTPLGMVAGLFDGWRGDIIFRFKVVCSPYHKGRLLIAFDPSGDATTNLINTVNVTSALHTAIIDIGVDDDVEIRVPFVQALAFLKTNTAFNTASIPYTASLTPTFNVDPNVDNGALIMRVLTRLTAPVGTAPVRIACFVRGADNMEFGNPRRVGQGVSRFIVQSQEVAAEGQTCVALGKPSSDVHAHQFRVNYGERVKSLRVLLHRANYIYTQADPTITATTPNFMTSTFGKLPPYRGFDPNGIHTATQLVGILTSPYNFVKSTPVSWILPCFVGYRGSTVWTFNANCNGAVGALDVVREPVNNMDWNDTGSGGITPLTRSGFAAGFLANKYATTGGVALTNQLTQAGLSVLCPNYNNYRFNSTAPGNATVAPTSGSAVDGSASDTFRMSLTSSTLGSTITRLGGAYVDKYWHAGPDFQPLFFLNTPSYYLQAADPTGV